MKQAYIFLFVLGVAGQLSAQSGCPGCIISLPVDLQEDTIFIQNPPNATVQDAYAEDISFRLPMSTTPVANTGGNVPPGLNLTEIEVLSVRNLPPGISWEASQLIFATQEETDGCVRFCGTPLMADSFSVEVVLKASIGPLFSQETSVFIPFIVEPRVITNDGFTLLDNAGCGSVTASFINNVPSNGVTGFTYRWDFGDGTFSEAEHPAPRTYTTPGVYPINYRAIVDTVGYFLSSVTVLETGCSDAFGGLPDLKINVYNPAGEIIYISPIVNNASVPTGFPVFIELEAGNYSVQVIDDDNGLGGADDDCGTIGFTRNNPGQFVIGDLTVRLEIFHPVDSVVTADSVFVYAQPAAPQFAPLVDPLICPEDSVELRVLNFIEAISWSVDSNVLALPDTQTTFFTNVPGLYQVTYTSADGCQSMATAPTFDVLDGVDTVQLENFGNVVQVFDEFIPAGLDPFWELDGQLIDEAQLRFCATQSGTYTLVLTDIQTGCVSRSSIVVEVDPNDNCDITAAIDRGQQLPNWSIFPNPSNGPIRLRGTNVSTGSIQASVVNTAGNVIKHGYFEVSAASNWQSDELDLQELPAGVYFLIVKSKDGVQTLPLIRQ